ncbi:hypothetical protein ONR57_11875 [Hoyosella sp. YIM 151337]|uniref:hypothetical protein n=1 Tax=Hoyosella sp. YIM 151337 TaxID=2992742 RepID=UPI002236994F|nr:hypothetical protein [Hoyosella sp. YIM 151337]MCW4353997.1 hypothetical protein [Hoyosella sp. YIM 151337]
MTNSVPLPGPRGSDATLQQVPNEVRAAVSAIIGTLEKLEPEDLASQTAVGLFESAHAALLRALESVDTV